MFKNKEMYYLPKQMPRWVVAEEKRKKLSSTDIKGVEELTKLMTLGSKVNRIAGHGKVNIQDTSGVGTETTAPKTIPKDQLKKTSKSFSKQLNVNKAKALATFYKVIGNEMSLFTNLDEFENLPSASKHMIQQEYLNLVKSGYGRRWNSKDVEDFKDRQYKKPCQRLVESLTNTKKIKEKIPLRYREIILANMDREEELQGKFDEEGAGLPNNVLEALGMF